MNYLPNRTLYIDHCLTLKPLCKRWFLCKNIIMNKNNLLKQFNESCKFYCDYHNVGRIEKEMICGNLGQVVLRIIEAVKKDKKSI